MIILTAFIKNKVKFALTVNEVKKNLQSKIFDISEHFFTSNSGVYGSISQKGIELFYHKKFSSRSPLIFKGTISETNDNQTEIEFSFRLRGFSNAFFFIYIYFILIVAELVSIGLFTSGIFQTILNMNFNQIYLVGAGLGLLFFTLLFSSLIYYFFYYNNKKHLMQLFDEIQSNNSSECYFIKKYNNKKNSFHFCIENLIRVYFFWISIIITLYLALLALIKFSFVKIENANTFILVIIIFSSIISLFYLVFLTIKLLRKKCFNDIKNIR